jgi:hypothetical protein
MMARTSLQELRKKPHWSYSSINTFLNICSLQWAFRYVYRHEAAFTPVALVFGSAFHRTLEYAFRLKMDGQAVPATTANLFSDLLSQLIRTEEREVRYSEGDDIDAIHQRGRKMVEAYLGDSAGDENVLDVSVPFRVLLGEGEEALEKPLVGEYDCIVQQGPQRLIVDWKTAARRWPKRKERLDLQPTCYLYAHTKNDPHSVGFRFDIVTKAKTPAVDRRLTIRHPDHFERLIEQVRLMEKMIRAEHFLPNDQSWACKGCPYGMACQAWHKERSRSLYNFALAA